MSPCVCVRVCVTHLVDLAVFDCVFGDGVCDLRAEDEEDGLQRPHGRLPFGALRKAVDQVEQLLCCLCARAHTHTHNENTLIAKVTLC